MFPERSASSLLYVQEDHDVVRVEVEPEVIVEDLVVGEAWLRHDVGHRPPRSLRVREGEGFRHPLPS